MKSQSLTVIAIFSLLGPAVGGLIFFFSVPSDLLGELATSADGIAYFFTVSFGIGFAPAFTTGVVMALVQKKLKRLFIPFTALLIGTVITNLFLLAIGPPPSDALNYWNRLADDFQTGGVAAFVCGSIVYMIRSSPNALKPRAT